MGTTRRGRSRVVTLLVSSAVLLGGAISAPAGSAAELCSSTPDVFPVADLEPGMLATAWTVVEGSDPVSFDVEILGVLPDGIAPGVDFILVHTSGSVIDESGGIAAGFSGSPVYIGGDLVGAISYGFSAADQTFGGVTPAEDMVRLLEYPSGTGALGTTSAASRPTFAQEVRVPSQLRRAAASAADTALEAIPTVAEPLRIPVTVSGLNTRGFRRFAKTLRLGGLSLIPYRSGAASLGALAADPLAAGDAVAGAVSVGDLTVAGVGTATVVCDDLLLAFGHPFFWDGRAGAYPMAMYGADVLQVIPDPSSLVGGFKVANLTDLHGIIDQDRLTGIRGIEGVEPASVPVTSVVVNPDIVSIREGETTVFRQATDTFLWLPDIAAFHLLGNQDTVFDRLGDGTVSLRFVLEGIGPDGESFRVVRPNMHFSEFDVSFESIVELFAFLFEIQDNPFGPVSFSSVHAESTITQEHLTAEIVRVESASSLQPDFRERARLRVRPGGTIRLRVFLLPEGATDEEMVELLVPVPRSRFGGSLTVGGGGVDDCLFCFIEGEDGQEDAPATFQELLRNLRRTHRNNDLVASLRVDRGRERESISRTDTVILGEEQVEIIVVR
ncbi:MAG: SpoIVB peptidase S55 domain-containing protein [Actinomycetota bacterium]